MDLLQLILGLLTATAIGFTIWGYPRKYGALSGRSRLFRTVGVGLIDLLLITLLIFFSTDWHAKTLQIGMVPHQAEQLVKISQMLYFLTWLLLGILLLGIALLDSLENFTLYRRFRREAMEEMIAGAIAAHQQKRTATAEGPHSNGNDSGSAA